MNYLLFLLIAVATLAADEAPTCAKCEKIREYNAAHPENNYYYYEDFLKDQAAKEHAKQEETPHLTCKCGCGACGGKDKKEAREREDHLLACCGSGKKPKKDDV